MENVSAIFMIVGIIVFTILYFKLYHSIFNVIYFNTCRGLMFELLGCFCLAGLTVGLIGGLLMKLAMIVGGVLSFVLKVIFFIIKLALVIGAVGVVVYLIYTFINKRRSNQNEAADQTLNNDMPSCPNCNGINEPDAKFCVHCGDKLY